MRFIEPVKPRDADGLVSQVYREINRDFALLRDPAGNSPFLAHSPNPELLAALWSAFYETILVTGTVQRADKETIATTISRINNCPFCIDAHALLTRVAGERRDHNALIRGDIESIANPQRRELVAWAAATRTPDHEILRHPPFTERQAPEVIGTAIGFHYVNRVVEVLQGHNPMNIGPAPLRGLVTPLVKRIAKRAMRRQHQAGRTLRLTPEAELPADLGWTRPAPRIAAAQARFAAAIERAGEAALPEQARARTTAILTDWNGTDPPLHNDWLNEAESELDPESRPAARVLLLTALAPYRIDHDAVSTFKQQGHNDWDLVAAVAWAAFRAARRISSWIAPAPTSEASSTAPP